MRHPIAGDPIEAVERLLARREPKQADALRQAINAIDAKLWKELGAAGLERIEAVGQPFDPTIHEAVSMMAAPSAELANTVAATLQSGYRYKGLLVRPARVAVL